MAFKDLFIKKEEDAPAGNPTPAVGTGQPQQNIPMSAFTSAGNMPANVAQSIVNPSVGGQEKPSANEEMVNQLWEAIKKRNFPGPDYLELKGHALSLAKRMPSYDQRLLAAFDILQGEYPDFTVDKVINSIDAYKKIIEDERKAGEKENEEVLGKRVANAETAYNDMEQKIADLQKKIQEEQNTLNGYFEERTTLQQNLEKVKADRILQTQAFAASVDAVINVLESDKQTIAKLTI